MIVSRHGTRRDDVGARRRRAERGGRRSGKEGRSDRGGGVVAATSISKSQLAAAQVRSKAAVGPGKPSFKLRMTSGRLDCARFWLRAKEREEFTAAQLCGDLRSYGGCAEIVER